MQLGVKEIETRSWAAPYRGDVAIHAAKHKMTQDDWDLFYDHIEPQSGICTVHFGCLLCVVELFECIAIDPCSRFIKSLSSKEFLLGGYDYGRFAWRTRNLRVLKEPVPMIGRQGLWTLTADEERPVRAQL